MTEAYSVDLLVTAPLLGSLGEPPQKIHVDFAGPLTSVTPSDLVSDVFTEITIEGGPLSGGGTFGSGQLLTGWTYSNIQINVKNTENKIDGDGNVIDTDNTQETNMEGEINGMFTSPDGMQEIPLIGRGTGNLQSVPVVPEPTTIALLGIGLVGLAGVEVRRRRKKKAVTKC